MCQRWRTLADDQSLWKTLCHSRGWEWKQPTRIHNFDSRMDHTMNAEDSDDEGMGDDEDDSMDGTHPLVGDDSGLASMDVDGDSSASTSPTSIFRSLSSLFSGSPQFPFNARPLTRSRHSAPSILPSLSHSQVLKPNYKLLHQTHVRLRNRLVSSSYRLSVLPNRGTTNGHANTIYCLQLYTYPDTGVQVLFTGSKDRTIREWNLTTGCVERVISGVHDSSVLSICVSGDFVASGGSDRKVAVWNLREDKLVKVICDHEDSVLCVRFDEQRLVSCSKGESSHFRVLEACC